MNPKLPEIPILAPSQPDAETLRRWLTAWEMRTETPEGKTRSPAGRKPLGSVHSRYEEALASYDSAPETLEPGCVRLLSSRILPEVDRPVYVLVLADWAEDERIVATFSTYAEPATTTEYRTGRWEPPLKVLSSWNAGSVRVEDLSQGWLATRFSPQEFEEAWAVFRNAATGEPLPEELQSRIGPPVPHTLDPRIEYQREEAAILTGLLAASLAQGELEEEGSSAGAATSIIHAFPGSPARWRDIVPAVRVAGTVKEVLTPGIFFPGTLPKLEGFLGSGKHTEPSWRFEARLLVAGSAESGETSPYQWDLEGTVAASAEGALAALVSPAKNVVLALGEVEDATLFIDPPTTGALSRSELEECVLVIFSDPGHG